MYDDGRPAPRLVEERRTNRDQTPHDLQDSTLYRDDRPQ